MVRSPIPLVLLWGEEGIMIYNDAYSEFAGQRHPALLGSRVREGWPEVADFNDNVMKVGLAGGTLTYRDHVLTLDRQGRFEEVWLDLGYSPVIDESGKPGGVLAIVVETTERVLASKRKEAEAERQRRQFEQAPGFIITMTGPDHVIGFVNEAHRRVFGSDDWVGKSIREAFPSIAGQGFFEALDQVYRTGEPVEFDATEVRYRRAPDAEEEVRRLTFIYSPVVDDAGRVTGTFCEGFDVTEQHRAHQMLEHTARNLETINRIGSAIAAQLDTDTVVQMVTDAGVELSGAQFGAFFYNVINAAGESYMLYTISGVDRAEFDKFPMPRNTPIFGPTFEGSGVVRSGDILADPRYGTMDTYHGMPPGHLPVRSYLAVPVVSRSGEVLGGLFFGHGETGRFEDRHEQLLVGIAGQAAVAIDNARLYQAAQRELAERRRVEDELRELNQGLEDRIAAAIDEREVAQEALRQSQKMESIGQLTGGIAHDFNNLLTVITGNVEAAKRHVGDQAEARVQRALGNALIGAERAATLTQRLLAFSRRQPLNPRPLEPNKLVMGMSELLHRTLGEVVAVETVLAAGLWQVEADANQLENAILNLAVNARDAMPEGGKVTIETANTHFDQAYVAANAGVLPGQYVMICVSDTGMGMDADTLGRVFEPFFTTKDVGKGTGLGLSMVYGFVKQSGGHIKVYSEPGEGTTVRIYLPRLIGETVPDDARGQDVPVPEGSRDETILVCEDDDDVRAYTVEALRELGYRVLEAHDGQSALRLLDRQEGPVDLLFTDVVLPEGMTGATVAVEARRLRPEIKVLFTTGYARNAIVHHGRLDPGVELITKPFAYSDLAARIRDLLDRG
ncbi:MAG: ATP-binding protein [Sphingomonas sp.]|uniref:ATP-binding protein n=1 Tax=Sphingomonas sp. TaxID=28214 RepID=UPI003F7DC343